MKLSKIILLSALLALTACSTDETGQLQENGERIPITFSAVDVQMMTRAADGLLEGNFPASTDINVNIKPGSAAAEDYTFTTTDASGAMSLKVTTPAQSVPYYPTGNNATIIKAWYPADAAETFVVSNAQNDDANYKASDLMYGKPWNGSSYIAGNSIAKPATNPAPDVNLKFEHLLSKVRVKVTKGTGVTSITSIKLKTVKTSTTFNSSTGTATTISGTTGDITIASSVSDIGDGTTFYAAIIPDQELSGQFLEIVTDLGSAYYSTTKTISAGHAYTLNITVNAAAIGCTNAITGWTNEGSMNVGNSFVISDIGESYTYNGVAKEPVLTVKYNGNTLSSASDYTVSYINNINAGTATAIVTGTGTYAGITGFKTFTIGKAAGSISYSITNVSKTFEEGRFTNALTKTGDGIVTYSSSNPSVATVNSTTGEVRVVGIGNTTIQAEVANSNNYEYATTQVTYNLTATVSYTGIDVGCVLYQSGVWSPTYDAALGTPIGLVFATNPTSYDRNLGWTHGYAIALKRYNNGTATSNWCDNSYGSTQVTDVIINSSDFPEQWINITTDMDGLKHCRTAYSTVGSSNYSKLTAIYAAITGYASEVAPPANSSGWYLPSVGQMYQWLVAFAKGWSYYRTVIPNWDKWTRRPNNSDFYNDFLLEGSNYSATAVSDIEAAIDSYASSKLGTAYSTYWDRFGDTTKPHYLRSSTEHSVSAAFSVYFYYDYNKIIFYGTHGKSNAQQQIRAVLAF